MSDYTITLKRCSEIYGKDEIISWFTDYDELNYISTEQYQDLISPDVYGIAPFDKNFLAKMIVEHYFMREIAYETPTLFKHYAKVKMQEIMGKYLPLIWSTTIKYDPLKTETFNYVEEFSRNKEDSRNNTSNGSTNSEGSSNTSGNSSSTSSSNSSGLNVNSDTPQGQINKNEILNGKYASTTSANSNENSINDTTNSSSSNNLTNSETRENIENSNGNENENYIRKKSGYDLKMTTMEKIQEFRKTIQNYNLQIIEDCNSLFFALY